MNDSSAKDIGASADLMVHLSANCCHSLSALLLKLANTSAQAQPSALAQERFRQLLAEEPQFADWLKHTSSFAPSHLAGLPKLLIERQSEWLSATDAADQPCADQLAAQRLLLDAAHLSMRVRAIEQNQHVELSSQKQAAMYNFAYGLSHELNNPLATIAAKAGTMASRETDPSRRQDLEAIVDNAMRGFELLGDLMLVARPPKFELQPTKLHELLQHVVERAERLCDERQIRLDYTPNFHGRVAANETALKEALWCLVRNAIEAVGHNGNLGIQTAVDDAVVSIGIRDDGPGLSQRALKNCFDPFFSDREAGRGLGLGLAKAQRIIELHGGQLSLSNLPTLGCSAIVGLPTLALEAEQ